MGSPWREPVATTAAHPTGEHHRGVRRFLPGVLVQLGPGWGLPEHGTASGIALELDRGGATATPRDVDGHGLGFLGSHGLPPSGAPSQPRDRPPGPGPAVGAADPPVGSRRARPDLCQDRRPVPAGAGPGAGGADLAGGILRPHGDQLRAHGRSPRKEGARLDPGSRRFRDPGRPVRRSTRRGPLQRGLPATLRWSAGCRSCNGSPRSATGSTAAIDLGLSTSPGAPPWRR